MPEDSAADQGQGDKHVLAETQVAGFGMANGKVVERLLIEFDRETPAAKLVHDRLDYAEPLRDRDPELETLREIVANPHDSHRDGEQKLETGSGYGKDRVIVDRHGHARRIYIRHEHFDNGEWNEAAAWELHPATGVEEFGGDLVTDGGEEVGRATAIEQNTVYLAGSNSGPKKYHTNPDCPDLSHALKVREIPLNHLHDHKDECARCAGTVEREQTDETDYLKSLKEVAKDPEEEWP